MNCSTRSNILMSRSLREGPAQATEWLKPFGRAKVYGGTLLFLFRILPLQPSQRRTRTTLLQCRVELRRHFPRCFR